MSRQPSRASAYQPVSPAAAMVESALRTVVGMAVGAVLTIGVNWLRQHGLDIDLSPKANEVATGITWLVLTSAYSAVQRKFWPTRTDHPGAGRTDLPPTKVEPPQPAP